jgi:hypothetical protein
VTQVTHKDARHSGYDDGLEGCDVVGLAVSRVSQECGATVCIIDSNGRRASQPLLQIPDDTASHFTEP